MRSNIRIIPLLPGPLAVTGLLREGGLQDQLVRLVVEVVVQIVPQQAVNQDSLEILEKLDSST